MKYDSSRGLYNKYQVVRTDGSSAPGGRHAECEYFVLDMAHDPHARAAILAYAESCKSEFPLLSQDLRAAALFRCSAPIKAVNP